MEIARNYQPREVNWLLVPELIERVLSRVPQSEKHDGDYELQPTVRFKVTTFSQVIKIDSGADFKEFMRTSTEEPLEVTAAVDCWKLFPTLSPVTLDRPYFRLEWWLEERLRISMCRTNAEIAFPLLREFEESLQLSPSRPVEQRKHEEVRELRRTAFLAHAFDDLGRSYAYQLTKFLSLLSFEVATGEGFAPESVSLKVRRRLATQELVLAIISEKQDHTWLHQEMAGAKFSEKPLIILVEEGVQFKTGILGDVEYISFQKQRISDCFSPLLEGLRELGFEFA